MRRVDAENELEMQHPVRPYQGLPHFYLCYFRGKGKYTTIGAVSGQLAGGMIREGTTICFRQTDSPESNTFDQAPI